MSIAPFPHRYVVKLEHDRVHALPRDPIHVGSPPQFGGTAEVWSPEELLVAAVVTCLKTTFDAYARRDSLEVTNWTASGTGVLAKGSTGPWFTEITIHVSFATKPGQEEAAHRTLSVAERNCILSKSVTCPVRVELTIVPISEVA
jgi:organic hydroperoxide reductase OsmC/OhrA